MGGYWVKGFKKNKDRRVYLNLAGCGFESLSFRVVRFEWEVKM